MELKASRLANKLIQNLKCIVDRGRTATRSTLFLGSVLILLIGVLDYLTGYEISFSIFYLFPVALVTWTQGLRYGILTAALCSCIWLVVDVVSGHQYSSPIIPIWNAGVRFGFFLFFTILINQRRLVTETLRGSKDLLELQVQERTAELQQAAEFLSVELAEKKRAEASLQISEKRFRDIAENASEWIWEVEANGNYTYASPVVERILGYKPEELLGKPFYDLFHPADCEELKKAAFEVFAKKEPFHEFINRNVHKNGRTVWLSTSGVPRVDEERHLLGFRGANIDITERKRSEKIKNSIYKISESAHSVQSLEELFSSIHRTFEELMPAKNFYIALYDPDSEILSFPYFVDEYDETPAPKKLGKGLTEYVLRSGKPLLASPEVFKGLVERGEVEPIGAPSIDWIGVPLKAAEKAIGVLVVQSYTEGVRYGEEEKNILKFVSDQVAMAIERKRAEERLRQSEERYRVVFEHSPLGIGIVSFDGTIVTANKAMENITGYSIDELKKINMTDIYENAEDRKRLLEAISEYGSVFDYTVRLKHKDGTPYEASVNVSRINLDGRDLLQTTCLDITERKRLQEQLLQAEKMSALGQLISGVAHELNNPLTAVIGFSQLMLMSPDTPEKERQTIEKVYQEAERARKIVQNLLTFARQHKPEKKRIQVNEIVDRTLELRAYEMRVSNIEIVRKFDPGIPSILADDHQLQQVFINLIINAEQAMLGAHGKGRLEVATRWDAERNVVRISFKDNGPGIAKEHLSKIFEPFFTTKPNGKGTGLGLSISYGIVEEHGGHISAFSKKGHGATFIVELPVVEGQISEVVATPLRDKKIAEMGEKKILVAEDEPAILDSHVSFLS